jgi:hypothetical protein
MNHQRAGLIARSPELDLYDAQNGLRVTTCVPLWPSDTVTSKLSAGGNTRVFDWYAIVLSKPRTLRLMSKEAVRSCRRSAHGPSRGAAQHTSRLGTTERCA